MSTPAEISDAMAAAAVARGEDLLDPGITLTWDGGQGMLDRGDLLRALTIQPQPGADEPFIFGLDPDLVRESMDRYAVDFDIPVQDARWRLVDGKIQLAVPESKGRELDLDRGVASVLEAFLDGDRSHSSTCARSSPLDRQGRQHYHAWRRYPGRGPTWYGDSSDARRENIEIASSYLNGWLVPPG